MSLGQYHPKKDIHVYVKPLLDAIAPDFALNSLELKANEEQRKHNPDIKPLTPESWQRNFLETKIVQALSLETISLSGVFDDKSVVEQAADIFTYLMNLQNPPPGELTDYVQDYMAKAPEYIQELHVKAHVKFDDINALDYDPFKAFVAFGRLVSIQLSLSLARLIEQFKEEEIVALDSLLRERGLGVPGENKEEIMAQLDAYIAGQIIFTPQERIKFRCHKAISRSLSQEIFGKEDHEAYFGGGHFDRAQANTNAIMRGMQAYPLSFFQMSGAVFKMSLSVAKSAVLFPLVKLQQVWGYVNQVSGLPLRLAQAKWQEDPAWGTAVEKAAKWVAPYTATIGVGLWELYQLFVQDENTRVEILSSLSPFMKYIFLGYVGASMLYAGQKEYEGLKEGADAYRRHRALGEDLIEAVVQENMADFMDDFETKLDAQGLGVLKQLIWLPEEVDSMLTKAQRKEIFSQIAQKRWAFCQDQPYFSRFDTPAIYALEISPTAATTVYLPSREPRADKEDLAQAMQALNLNDEVQVPHQGPQF